MSSQLASKFDTSVTKNAAASWRQAQDPRRGFTPGPPWGLPFLTPPNLTYQFQKHSTVPVKKYYIVSGKKSDTNCVKMTEISYTIPSKFNDPKDDMQWFFIMNVNCSLSIY